MFDFSVISDSWNHIIDGCIQTVGGLVTAVGGVAAGVGSCGLAIPLGAGIAGYGGYQLGTGLAAIAEGVWVSFFRKVQKCKSEIGRFCRIES